MPLTVQEGPGGCYDDSWMVETYRGAGLWVAFGLRHVVGCKSLSPVLPRAAPTVHRLNIGFGSRVEVSNNKAKRAARTTRPAAS